MKLLFILTMLISSTMAQELQVTDARIKVLPSKTTAIYLNLNNQADKDLILQKVESDISDDFELHEMSTQNGKMEMRQVSTILIPQKKITELKPGGLHIMVFNLNKKIEINQKYKLDLTISGKKYSVEALGFEP